MPDDFVEEPFQYYRRLKRLDEYLRADISRPISAQDAAALVGLEKHYFSTWFRARAGISFSDWVTTVRLARAEDLFREHNYTVLEVALRVGFGNLRSFERACKRHLGLTPTQLKERARRFAGGGDKAAIRMTTRGA